MSFSYSMEMNHIGFNGVAFVKGSVDDMCPELDGVVGRQRVENRHRIVDGTRHGGRIVMENQPFEPGVETDGVERLCLLVPAEQWGLHKGAPIPFQIVDD